MKKTFTLLLASLSLIGFSSCSDSEEAQYVKIANDTVVFVDEDQNSFNLNDYLWLNIDIPSTQMDEFSGKSVDIHKLVAAKETFFTISLFEIQGDAFSPMPIDYNNVMVEAGHLNTAAFETDPDVSGVMGVALYHNGRYQLRVGIPLAQTGQFFIGNASQNLTFNATNGSDHQIDFATQIRASDTGDRYYFSVQ